MRRSSTNKVHASQWSVAVLTVSTLVLTLALGGMGAVAADGDRLAFDASKFTVKTESVGGRTVKYRVYEGIVYVADPVDTAHQSMNLYVPAEYFEGKSVGAYNAETAPILFQNRVGGYMPAFPGTLGSGRGGPGGPFGPGGGPGGPPPAGGPGGPPPGGIFDEFDKNKDGKLSRDEAPEFIRDQFAQIDTDKDGFISREEDQAFLRQRGPGGPGGPGMGRGGPGGPGGSGGGGLLAAALARGMVVAAPGARGSTSRSESGNNIGKAPACIVDLKAALRYLRHNDKAMPGNAERIISNGTSAGGALSALLGGTGNSPDYDPYLKAIGAAEERDDIFAASCYCPITDLDHADMAYEWMFNGLNQYNSRGGRGTMSADQVKLSGQLKTLFPAHLNSLGLRKADGTALTLDARGEGPFKDYVKSFVIASAQKALDTGKDLSGLTWITIKDGKVTDIAFDEYIAYATRMKSTPAFDSLALQTPENLLFGDARTDRKHFTQFGKENGSGGSMADPAVVKMMNPMYFIGATGTTTAPFWRVRHGAADRDTSLAVPVMLAAKLRNVGRTVDFASPWGQGHGGDYDPNEFFAWVDLICRQRP